MQSPDEMEFDVRAMLGFIFILFVLSIIKIKIIDACGLHSKSSVHAPIGTISGDGIYQFSRLL